MNEFAQPRVIVVASSLGQRHPLRATPGRHSVVGVSLDVFSLLSVVLDGARVQLRPSLGFIEKEWPTTKPQDTLSTPPFSSDIQLWHAIYDGVGWVYTGRYSARDCRFDVSFGYFELQPDGTSFSFIIHTRYRGPWESSRSICGPSSFQLCMRQSLSNRAKIAESPLRCLRRGATSVGTSKNSLCDPIITSRGRGRTNTSAKLGSCSRSMQFLGT
jgi:hypothetical protein